MNNVKKALHVASLGAVGAFVIMTMWIPGAGHFYNWLCFRGLEGMEAKDQ